MTNNNNLIACLPSFKGTAGFVATLDGEGVRWLAERFELISRPDGTLDSFLIGGVEGIKSDDMLHIVVHRARDRGTSSIRGVEARKYIWNVSPDLARKFQSILIEMGKTVAACHNYLDVNDMDGIYRSFIVTKGEYSVSNIRSMRTR